MSCTLITNDKNKVIGVLNKEGKPSALFKSIISTPLLTFDEALSAYKNIYTKQFESFEEEPVLTYQTPNGNIYNTYSEALQNTSEGDIKGLAGGIEIFSVNASKNIDSFYGAINDFVADGLLSGVQYLDADGILKHEVAGKSLAKKAIHSEMIKQEARKSMGVKNVVQYSNGDFTFKNEKGKLLGEVDIQEVLAADPKELIKREDGLALLAHQAYNNSSRAFSDIQETETVEFVPENELQVNLMNLLNNLGVKTLSISDYVSKYKIKNNVEPSAQALASIADQVIAFKDGKITPENLTEETAHFIVEAWEQTEIQNILRNIHKTQEWNQYVDTYREIYSKEYSAEDVDEAVRREVLGKILATSLQNRFQQQTENATETAIVSRVFQLFSNFIDRVSAFFRPEYQTQLDKFNTQIYQNLMEGQLQEYLNENNFKDNRFRLYSTSNPATNEAEQLRRSAEQAVTLLEALNYRMSKGDISAKQALETTKEKISGIVFKDANGDITAKQAEKVASVAGITSIAQNQIKYLRRAIKKNKGSNFYLSQEDLSVYTALVTDFATNINTMKALVKGEKELEKMLEDTSIQINELQGEANISQVDSLDRLVSEYSEKAGLTQQQEDDFRAAVKGIQTDTNAIFANVGQLVNAKNALLSLAADITSRVTTEHRISYQRAVKGFLKELGDVDYTKLGRFKKGNYLENIFDDTKRETAMSEKKFELYIKEVSTLEEEQFKKAATLTKEQFDKASKEGTLPKLPISNQTNLNKEYRAWENEEFNLSAYTAEELKRREDKYAPYSEVTKNFESESSMQYGYILSKADKVDGRTVLDRELKSEIEALKKNRFERKSIFASDGELRKGLDYVSEEGDGVVKIGKLFVKLDKSKADVDATLAFELNQIDEANRLEFEKGGKTAGGILTDAFKDYISTLSEEDAKDFLFLNSYISFSQEYYDAFDKNKPTLVGKLQDAFDKSGDLELERLIENINETSVKISNILKANRTLNQPSEINFEGMSKQSGGETNSVRLLQEELQTYYKEAYSYLPKEEYKEADTTTSESSTNEAYEDFLSDSGVLQTDIPQFLRLIQEHVTTRDWNRILDAQKVLNKGSENIPKLYQNVFKGDYEGMSKEAVKELMTEEFIAYTETKLLPYFRRTTPIGFSDVLRDLRRGDISMEDFLENYERGDYKDFLTITPNTNFQDAVDDSKKNLFYETNKKNNTPQYRVKNDDGSFNKYVNQEYIAKYGIEFNEDGSERATKNLEDYRQRQALINLQKQSLDALGELGRQNVYKLPQFEKGTARKFQDVLTKGGIKRFVEEFSNYRSDNIDFGQTANGDAATNAYLQSDTVPKYGLRDLPDSDLTSDELLTSYTAMIQQAMLYKSRVENIPDMLSLRDSLLGAKFGNKKADATNAYKMFESNLKYNFFGVRESIADMGQFEIAGIRGSLGAIANSFTNYISFVNLSFNPIIPATSAITGGVQLAIERVIGERLDKDSRFLADKEFSRLATAGVLEIGAVKSTAKINVLGDAFGINDINDRFQNSNYGRFGKVMMKTSMFMHSAANYPIIPRVMLSVLYDHKIVNGQMLNFRQFKLRRPDIKESDARKEWKNYTSVYETIEVKDGIMEFNKTKLADLRGTNEGEDKFISNMHNVLSNRINQAASEIDGSISSEDKSTAARNSYLRIFFLHKNWASIAIQKRFRSRGFSTRSGFVEEGVYMTLPRLLNNIATDYRVNKKDFIQSVRDNWKLTMDDPGARANLKRMLVEMGVLNGLAGLVALATAGLKDNDDDDYLEVMTEYLLLRTLNESLSTNVGLPSEMYGMLEKPTVGLDKLNIFLDSPDMFDDTIVQRGKYKGITQANKYWLKNLPIAKEWFNNTHLEDTRNTYNYYNVAGDSKFNYTLYPYLVSE